MLNEMLNILSKMNSGRIFDHIDDSDSKRDLISDYVRLYVDKDGKNYFFAQYVCSFDEDNFTEIEDTAINKGLWDDLHIFPHDSYMILFWEVNSIDDFVFKRVIDIEESESFYKKYVIYYTKNELNELTALLDSMGTVSLDGIIKYLSELDDYDQNTLARRILIKIPFWRLSFPQIKLSNFESLVNESLFSARNDSNYNQNEVLQLKKLIDDSELDLDSSVNQICRDFLGDFFNGI